MSNRPECVEGLSIGACGAPVGSYVRVIFFQTSGRYRRARAALGAACGAIALLTLVSAAALVGAPTAAAAACDGATVTATPMHSPDGTQRPFYGEFRSGSTKHSGYVGYELTDNASALGTDVWVRLSGFTGGALGLAANQSAGVPVRATSGSGKRLVYAYLTATAEVATAQTFTVEIWNGKPGLTGSTQVCTMTDGFSKVLDVLDAAANKITAVSVSTAAPAIGGSFFVTAAGDTGTMGAGDSSDQVGGNGVFSMAPSMEDAWPADAFTLTGVRVSLGGTDYRDRLRVYPGTSAAGEYTATYTFTVRKATTGSTPVRPVQNIASGTQVKYTGSYSGTLQDIGQPVLTTALAKSVASLAGPPYAVTYQVVASNSGGGEVILDYLRDTPSPSGAWTFLPGSARLDGAVVPDPQNDAGTLVFKGPFTLPGGGALTFRYTLELTATVANSVVGLVGDVEIGGTGGGGENAVTVDPDAPVITTADVPDATQGTAYSTTLAATGGTSPYSWSVSAGSLPAGLSVDATSGAITGTPTAAGSSSFTIRVADAVPESATRAFTLTVAAPDTTAPAGASVQIDGGAASATATGVTLTLTATDAVGVTAYRVANGTDCSAASWVSVTAATSLSEPAAFALSGGDGTRTVCAQFRDAAGNISITATDAIVLDTTAPTAAVAVDGGAATTTSTAVTLTLVAGDAVGVTAYRVAAASNCSSAAWVAVTATSAFSVGVAFTLPGGDGAKTVCAEFRDAAGHTSPTATASIALDETAPTAAFSSTAPVASSAASFLVTLTFSEAVTGMTSGDLSIGNGSASGLSGAGATYTFTVTAGAEGAVTVDLAGGAAADAAGNGSTAAPRLTRTYDATAPVVSIVSRPPSSTTSRDATIGFTVSDPLATVACRVDGGAPGPCASPFALAALALGAHSVEISAIDATGSTGTATTAWTVAEDAAPSSLDTTPPVISILSRPPAATGATSATIPFSVDDATATATCSLDGGPFVPCSELVSRTGLVAGRHAAVIRAVDTAGNTATQTVEWVVAAGAAPDVRVAITSTASTLVDGIQFDLTATARNVGRATATGVVLTVMLPPDAEFVRGEARLARASDARSLRLRTAAFPCSLSGRLVSCAVGTLDPDDEYVVVLTLRALRSGGLNATAATDAANAKPASASIRTGSTHVSLGLRVQTARPFNDVRTGEAFTATATLRNAGKLAAVGVQVRIALPAGTRLAGRPPAGCKAVAGAVVCDVGTLAAKGSYVVKLRLRATAGGHVELRARATTATQRRIVARASVRAPKGGCTIYGTTRVVLGTPGDDIICLSPGFHLVLAGTGDDVVYGRSGRQVIYGGAGDDVLYGDADDDYVDGGPGNDVLEGGAGADKLLGRLGDDRLRGGRGDDRLHGGRGADIAQGDADDLVFEIETGGEAGWRTGAAGASQLIVKRGSR